MSASDKDNETQEIPAQKDTQPGTLGKDAPAGGKASAPAKPGDKKSKKGKKSLFGGHKKDRTNQGNTGSINFKEPVTKIKAAWTEQSTKNKVVILAVIGAIFAVAIILTVAMNANADRYVVLYPSLESSEINDVYSAVKEKGVMPKIENGTVMVPADQYNSLLLELASEGYPKSTLTYDVYTKNNGMTATESDKKTYLLYQLQNRIQDTLKSISNVSNAKVTLTPTDDSQYVWQQANSSDKASASVLMTMEGNHELAPAQVTAIKNLVSHSLSNLAADDVSVVDAKSGQELSGKDSSSSMETNGVTALECEQLYQKKLEQNVKKLLQARYGSTGVAVSAKVTLDFDKMMQEKKDLTRATDSKDAVTHEQHSYSLNGQQPGAASGIAGEESNTDVPKYVNSKNPTSSAGTTNYTYSKDIDYGYIKTQIEKGQPDVKAASISVLVNDTNMGANKAGLVDLVSKSTNIPAASISVDAINPGAAPAVSSQASGANQLTTQQMLLLLAVIAALFIIIVVVLMARSKRRAKVQAEKIAAQAEDEAASSTDKMRSELEAYKHQLEDNARAKVNEKDQIAADEVRDFAKQNPQITAELLRSWLKGDGQ